MGAELLEVFLDGEKREVVDRNAANVVVIDTAPVGTVDFNLQQIEKDFLLKIGKASALKFLRGRNLDDGPDDATVNSAIAEAEACRHEVIGMRKRRRHRHALIGLALLIILSVAILIVWRAEWVLPHMAESPTRIELPDLDKSYIGLADKLTNDAEGDSTNELHARPYILLVTWKRPLLFGAKHFGVRIRSAAHEIHGFVPTFFNGRRRGKSVV